MTESKPRSEPEPDKRERDDPERDDPEPESSPPLNRAERRARRRGKQPAPPQPGKAPQAGPHGPVVVPRRSGRRGNR